MNKKNLNLYRHELKCKNIFLFVYGITRSNSFAFANLIRTSIKTTLIAFMLIAAWIATIDVKGQNINFSISKGTVYKRDVITFTNNSTGLPANTNYLWTFSPCLFSTDTTIHEICDTTVVGTGIGITGYFDIKDSATITLTAMDNNGKSLPYTPKIIKIAVRSVLISCPTASCNDAVNDPCVNLVCNGNFDYFNPCPDAAGEICYAAPWVTTPAGSSPDYYNSCFSGSTNSNNMNNVSTPMNSWTILYPHSGNGYAGYLAYVAGGGSLVNTREYIQAQLKSTLVVGQKYKIEVFADLASKAQYKTNGLQVYLSSSLPQAPAPEQLITGVTGLPGFFDLTPNDADCIVTSNQWTKLSKIITATSNLSYISIGNFKADNDATFYRHNWNSGVAVSMIIIDDVSIKLAPNVVATPNTAVCSGTTVTINSNYPCSHVWSSVPNDQTLAGQTTNNIITVSPTVTTTYYLTTNDPDLNTSVTVTVNQPPSFTITGNANNCATTCQYTISNFTSAIWTWSVNGSPAQVFTTNPFTINWGASGLNLQDLGGTITVTANNNGCITTSTFNVNGCCSGTPPNTFNDATIDSSSTIINSNIVINGTLTITNNGSIYPTVNWSVVHVYLGPNAKIIVNPGCTLNIDRNSVLKACDSTLWDGIYVYGTGLVYISLSTVEEALNAVVSNSGGTFQISNSKLKNNYNNIIINPYSGAYNSYIKNTVINCTWPLLVPYNNQRTYSGIIINELASTWSIGDASSSSYNNTFDNMWFGIVSTKNSNLTTQNITIQNNTFTNISYCYSSPLPPYLITHNPNASAITFTGNGCSSKGQACTLTVGGTGTYSGNKIGTTAGNCYQGVVVSGKTNTTIRGNTFTNNSLNGAFVNNVMYAPISITNNTFDNITGTAISTYNTNSVLAITSNTINPTNVNTTNVGISVSDNYTITGTNPYTASTAVSMNTIKNCYTGIFGTVPTGVSQPTFIVYDNIVNMPATLSANYNYGIRVENCVPAHVYVNTVSWSGTPNSSSVGTLQGIRLMNCTGSTIEFNTITKMGSGIYCNLPENPSTLACNTMNGCYNGVYLDNTSIGDQGASTSPFGNQWPNNIGAYRVTGNLVSGATVKWYYETGANYTLATGQYYVTNGLFNPYSTGTSGDICSGGSSSSSSSMNANSATTMSAGVATTSITTSAQRQSYLGVDNTNLTASNVSAYTNESDYFIKKNGYKLIGKDTTILHLGLTDDKTYQQFYYRVKASNIGKFDQISSLISSGTFAAALAQNTSIIPLNIMETNTQTVNNIYLHTWANNQFALAKADSVTLKAIAIQHPYKAGDGVFLARVMLQYYPDNKLTTSSSRLANDNIANEVAEQQIIHAYPNPAKNELNISFNQPDGSYYTLELTNLLGKTIYKKALTANTNVVTISLSDVANGIYICRISNSNNINLYNDKLIIIK